MSVLDRVASNRVEFDPSNDSHIDAAIKIINGSGNPSIRFFLDAGYTNVRDMLLFKLATEYIKERKAA